MTPIGDDLSTVPAPADLLERKVSRIRVGMLYDQLRQGLIATVINAVLTAWVLSPVTSKGSAFVWFWLVIAVCVGRLALLNAFNKEDRNTFDHALWHNRFAVGAILSAILWGSVGVALFPAASTEHQAFIGFVLAGMAAGASGSMSGDDRVFKPYLVLTIAPYIGRLLFAAQPVNLAMAVMGVAFIAAMSLSARKTARSTVDALRLRYENQELIAKLETKADELAKANSALIEENIKHQATETDLIKANTDVKAATTAKSRFLANMSHEIRTPMNGVFGMTDLLMRTDLDERQRKLVKTINESAKSLLTIINDILDISRIEAGKLDLDIHEYNFRDTIEQATDLFAGQADSKGIELTILVDRNVPVRVKGDSGRLKQIFLNLVGNALKFTKYGEVGISATRISGDETTSLIRIEIRDTGIGIDPATQEHLFQPFSQAETSISRRFGGTGLGLSISRHLVDLMGGSLVLASELGKGTTITIELPLDHGDAAGMTEESDPTVLEGARILAIDDREINLTIIRNYLEQAGATITTAASAAEAWLLLKEAAEDKKPFHAAIVDMMMPGENGLELSRRMQNEPKLAITKTILATSINWQGDLAAIREAGIEAVLTKPLRAKDLTDTAARAIAGNRHPGWRLDNTKRRKSPSAQPRPNFKARVLLAEDNPVNVEVALEFLTGFGCTVHVASNGMEAVAFNAATTYDIILMDCQMPVMDGLTAARRIRGIEIESQRRRTPILAVTANAFAEDRMHCIEAGMDDYLCKPYSETQLENALSKWISISSEIADPGADGAIGTADSTAPAASSVIDNGVISTLRAKRPDLLIRLAKTYLDYAPTALAELTVASKNEDHEAMGRLAHSLKSSSANLGATTLSAACRQLEVAAKEKRSGVAAGLVANLNAAFTAVRKALEAEISAIEDEKRRKFAVS